jgi:2-polyprenyl-6-methoxyphenol hydroxylase-like FAD-dependent oxidoreductase
MYLCPAGVALLARLGLHDRLAVGARRLHGMIMVAPNLQRLTTHFPSGDGIPAHGLALRRPQLDEALLEFAREAGATVLMGTRPDRIERAAGSWVATISGGEKIRAHLLIGADGRKSSTARLLDLALPTRRSRVAIHIDRPSLVPTEPFGQMHLFDDGAYVGINAIDSATVNLSFVCDPEALHGLAVTQFINDHIARSPHLSRLVGPLPTDVKPGATFPTNARVRSAATADAALVGDASGYVDPLTGEGIYGALWTADELARCVIDGWNDLPAALARYARRRADRERAKALVCELFQQIICRPWLADSIQYLLSRRQQVADSFIGIVGNSYSPFRGIAQMAHHAVAF